MLSIFLIMAMLGCDFFSKNTDTQIETTTAISSTTSISTVSTEADYEGPYFIGISATDYIPEENIDLNSTSNQESRLLSFRQYFNHKQSILAFDSSPSNYYTTKLAKEYLVIEIEQPPEVEDQYVISSITITYPSGTKIKWTNSTTEPGGTRKWYSNFSNTLFYIPFTAPSDIETAGYIYQVSAIQYIDGVINEDVRFSPEAIDYINVFVEKKAINTQGEMMAEYWPDENKIVLHNFYNDDGAIVKEVYINDVLQFSGDTLFESGDRIDIVNPYVSFSDYFVTVTVIFDNGLGILRSVTGLAIKVGTYPAPYYYLPISNLEQLNKIPRDYTASISLVDNITLPSDFEPFTGYQLTIAGNGRTLTVPEEATLWEYLGDPIYIEMFPEGSINIRDCSIIGKIRLVNHTTVPYNLFTHASIDHFTLINITYIDLNNF